MPTHMPLHSAKATSVNARIAIENPKIGHVNFVLANDEGFLSVEVPRHELERLIPRIRRALDESPLPARRGSGGDRPASGRSK